MTSRDERTEDHPGRGAARSRAGGSDTIHVRLNGHNRELPAGLSVTGLLERLELQPGMVVVERNREILERARYPEVTVEEGDTLELVHFVGGG